MAQDPFTIMRATFTLQRLMVLQRASRGEQNLPPLLTCRDVLEFATIAGARCANLDRKVGTITPGKEADLVLLAADRSNTWPLNNAPGAVVNLMNPSNVETVMVAGKVKKWRGNLVGLDLPRVLRLAEEARDNVLRRSGFAETCSVDLIDRPDGREETAPVPALLCLHLDQLDGLKWLGPSTIAARVITRTDRAASRKVTPSAAQLGELQASRSGTHESRCDRRHAGASSTSG